MLNFLAHMAFNAAGIAALLSIRHDLRRLFRPWLQVLADHRASQGNRP